MRRLLRWGLGAVSRRRDGETAGRRDGGTAGRRDSGRGPGSTALPPSRHPAVPLSPEAWRAGLHDAYLRRLDRLALTSRLPATGGLGGEHRSRARAPSTDFADYRRYQPGDDFRRIDWNAYGRLDQLYVKLTEARERLTVHLVLDCSASMEAGQPRKLDYARLLVASLGYVALRRFDRVVVRALFGSRAGSRPFGSVRAFGDLLGFLDSLRGEGESDFETGLAQVAPSQPCRVVLVSDLLDPRGPTVATEALARMRSDAAIVQVLSPDELNPEAGGDVELLDVETGETVEVGLSPEAVAAYRERVAAWCDECEAASLARGLSYARASSDEGLEEVVVGRLRQRGVLA